MSPTSISGWIPSPARSNRFRSPDRATTLPPQRTRAPRRRAGRRRAAATTPSRASTRGCRRSQPRARRSRPSSARTSSARPTWSSARPAQVYRPSPPLSPASLDFAIAEIAARQNELDSSPAPRPMPPRSAPPTPCRARDGAAADSASPPPGPDFSALERHLFKITSQIEALQRPDGIEQSIAAFRGELAEIRHAITEAMPRRAIESIENEIRSLSRRIDDTRQNGIDGQALAGIERALGEIREVLRSLTPAEQLAGYDEAIRNLGAKLDLILRASDDPSTVQQLEGAIAALRAIVSNVASNDALARLHDDVHMLSSKVDQLAARRRQQRFLRDPRTAHRGADLDAGKPRAAGGRAKAPNSSKARCGRCPTASTACRSATTTHPPSPISNSACPICSNGSKPRPITAPPISAGSRTGCRTSCAISKTSMRALRRWPRAAAARAAAGRQRPDRHRQARIVRHPLQPDRKPTATPRIRSKPSTTRSAMWSTGWR